VKAENKKEENLPLRRKVVREVAAWMWVALAFLLINGTLGQARVIPSGSMENTLLIGDHLIMSRIGYDAGVPFTNWHLSLWRDPQRQQVVIFRPPFNPDSPDLVKRVIGIPGDRIKIVNQQVYVNEKKLNEPYAVHDFGGYDGFGENFPPSSKGPLPGNLYAEWTGQIRAHIAGGELVVPPGDYFVMGDNRDNSYDSRFWGFVPRSAIIGTPVVIYMSVVAPSGAWDSGQIRERILAYARALIHPRLVRWSRLFRTF
jgi:signal peptidase I